MPCDEALPALGIGMTNDVFQINGKAAVRCSVAMGPRFFKWKMLRESEPYALLFLQFLIALVTWSLVNDSASSRDIRFTSFDT